MFLKIPPQTHNPTATSIESLSRKERKREIECDLVKKSTIHKAE